MAGFGDDETVAVDGDGDGFVFGEEAGVGVDFEGEFGGVGGERGEGEMEVGGGPAPVVFLVVPAFAEGEVLEGVGAAEEGKAAGVGGPGVVSVGVAGEEEGGAALPTGAAEHTRESFDGGEPKVGVVGVELVFGEEVGEGEGVEGGVAVKDAGGDDGVAGEAGDGIEDEEGILEMVEDAEDEGEVELGTGDGGGRGVVEVPVVEVDGGAEVAEEGGGAAEAVEIGGGVVDGGNLGAEAFEEEGEVGVGATDIEETTGVEEGFDFGVAVGEETVEVGDVGEGVVGIPGPGVFGGGGLGLAELGSEGGGFLEDVVAEGSHLVMVAYEK